ncbi:hypothetical protein LTR12_015937 [Friedmanniomyces endolithicus]|nr:hypothetical protein LTR12_015937 [Friedmanniomyces endolithicus]
MIPAAVGTGSNQVTSWTQVVSAVTLGASSQKLSFTTVPSYTVINILNSSGRGPTFVTSWTRVVETVHLSGTAAATGGSSQATATPADNAASSEDTYGKGATILRYSWNTEQTFLGTYLAVLIAVIYRMFWTVINNNFNLIEPFRQLNESSGAVAERALFSFYQTQSTLLGPLPALLKRRWALALVGITYLATCVMPALGSEAIYVDTDWGCANPMEGPNPCQARMTADVTILRILQGFLAFAALALLVLISLLLLTKTGLPANPSSMATVASLMRNPALLDDLNEIPPDADAKHMQDALSGRRYKLDAYKTTTGELGYGIVPAYGNGQDEQNHSPGYAPLAGVATSSRSHRFRLTDLVLALAVLGIFGVVLAYYFDGKHDGFNDYFSSNTFGPRFILTFAATIVASLWKTVEQSAVIVAPYTRLAHHPSSAKSTILFTPHNTPFLATLTAIWNRYFLVAIITFVTLTAEGLNIVISGVPYATGQTWTQFLVSIYMSLGILGLMVVVSVLVILSRRREPKMPRKPDTVGAVMSYLSTSKMLHDFDGVDWQDGEERDRRIRLVGKRYTFLQRRREDGKQAWSVDEVYSVSVGILMSSGRPVTVELMFRPRSAAIPAETGAPRYRVTRPRITAAASRPFLSCALDEMPEEGWEASRSNSVPESQSMSSSDTSSSLGLAPVNEDELASLPITERLERMTVLLFQTVNARDFDSPIISRYLSPTFHADDIDGFIPSTGCRHSYIDDLRKASSDDQMYDHQITSTCAEVDEDQAVVWATLRTTISPYGHLVQETVSRLRWVFKGKRIGWVCTEHRGLRGGGELGAMG